MEWFYILIIILIILIILIMLQQLCRYYIYYDMINLNPYENKLKSESYLYDNFKKTSETEHPDGGLYYDKITYNRFEVGGMHSAIQIKNDPFSSGFNYDIEVTGVQDGDVVLDCGCGLGGLGMILLNKFPNIKYEALTNSNKQYAILIERFSAYNNAKITLGNFDDLNIYYPSMTFNGIFFCESIGYSKNINVLLSQIHNLLKPNGWLYIRTVSLTEVDNDYIKTGQNKIIDYWKYDFSTILLPALIQSGFQDIKYKLIPFYKLVLTYPPKFYYDSLMFCLTEIKTHKHYDIQTIISHLTVNGLIIRCIK
jgi:SAM-dependent methyltransferase